VARRAGAAGQREMLECFMMRSSHFEKIKMHAPQEEGGGASREEEAKGRKFVLP